MAEPAFYDHEHEVTRDRERRADDWGADALFSGNPRRRFERRPAHGFERRASGPARPEAQPRAVDLTDGVKWTTPEPSAARRPAAGPPAAEQPTAGPPSRRTVVVTGRPGAVSARRRPPQTPRDRLGARPDRVAGWAFGFGLLLVAVAAAPL